MNAWTKTAAHEESCQQQSEGAFERTVDLEEFFKECDGLDGPVQEPHWEEHLVVINESRLGGATTDQGLRGVGGQGK